MSRSNEFQARLQEIVEKFKAAKPANYGPRLPQDIEAGREVFGQMLSELVAGVDSFESLLSVLEDSSLDPDRRGVACWVLGQLSEKRALKALLRVFADENTPLALRWEAAKSLEAIGSKTVVGPLMAILRATRNTDTRVAAIYAFGWLRDVRTIGPLLGVLGDQAEDSRVRGQAAESLAYILDYREDKERERDLVMRSLIAALKDPSVEVRFWSAFALGTLGDKQAIPPLKKLVATDESDLQGWWSIRKEASDAMKHIRNRIHSRIPGAGREKEIYESNLYDG